MQLCWLKLKWKEKMCTSIRYEQALRGYSSKPASKVQWRLKRCGLQLVLVLQEPPQINVSRILATTAATLVLSHSWTSDWGRNILPVLFKKGLDCHSGLQSPFFYMRVNSAFHLEIKVLETGGRALQRRRFRARLVPSHNVKSWGSPIA